MDEPALTGFVPRPRPPDAPARHAAYSPVELSDLATQCNSTQPRLSKVMTRFEQHGWVTRRLDPDNGRYTLATLTDTGMQKVAASAPAHVEQVRKLVFEPLTAAQQRHLGTALARITAPIREQLDGG